MWTIVMIWLKKLAWPIAALLSILGVLASRRGGQRGAADKARDGMNEAVMKEIDERKRRKEAEADAAVDKERGLDPDDQRDAVMERMRDRRTGHNGS